MLQKLEKKFGRFAIRGLMKYVVIVYAAGFIIDLINPTFYYNWLMLDMDKLLKGQVWRLFTFVIQPMEKNIIFMALMMYVYYSIGITLERVWGTFRFNLFYFMGILSNILSVVIIYVLSRVLFGYGVSFPISLSYLNTSMFLAFAVTFPDLRFYLMYLIPMKAKWLGIIYIVMLGYDIATAFVQGGVIYGSCIAIVVCMALANFFVYFAMTKRYLSPKNIKRKVEFSRNYTRGMREGVSQQSVDPNTGAKTITRHKCAICGRTELSGDDIQFRFCSKCNGNYEYCNEHLFTHEHVQ